MGCWVFWDVRGQCSRPTVIRGVCGETQEEKIVSTTTASGLLNLCNSKYQQLIVKAFPIEPEGIVCFTEYIQYISPTPLFPLWSFVHLYLCRCTLRPQNYLYHLSWGKAINQNGTCMYWMATGTREGQALQCVDTHTHTYTYHPFCTVLTILTPSFWAVRGHEGSNPPPRYLPLVFCRAWVCSLPHNFHIHRYAPYFCCSGWLGARTALLPRLALWLGREFSHTLPGTVTSESERRGSPSRRTFFSLPYAPRSGKLWPPFFCPFFYLQVTSSWKGPIRCMHPCSRCTRLVMCSCVYPAGGVQFVAFWCGQSEG